MSAKLKIFIVGGYGAFGGRLVELLEHEPRLTLIVAGRSKEKAARYCQARGKTQAALVPETFDRNGDVGAQLDVHHPDIVVDASGPFQAYGENRYRLVEACIARRIAYLDLADGSDFVAGIGAFDKAARAAGIFVLSGVSSCPVLTAAAVRALSRDMVRVESIHGGIAPSPHARVGLSVVRAIASYAGQCTLLKRSGSFATAHPFTEQMRFTIAPPGYIPLKRRTFSLVDVPDLRLLPELWPEAKTVWMGAAPVPASLHYALIGLAWLSRLRLVPPLRGIARLMHFAASHLRWGEHRGGMFVAVKGMDKAGASVTRSWHLVAEGDDGPYIPSMPVAAIIGNVVKGKLPSPGARAATRDLELADYAPLFASRNIVTGIREQTAHPTPLQARILGSAWDQLPLAIRAMHDIEGSFTAEGRAVVERGKGIAPNLLASLFGFPEAGSDIPLSVHFKAASGEEVWTRSFAGKSFSSRHYESPSEHLLCERFGPLTFKMALVADTNRVRLVLRRWSAFGLPLPMWLCPRSNAYETVEDGRFRFHVEITMPWAGLLVRYRGWLAPATSRSAVA